MTTHFRPALVMLVLFTLLTGIAYPLAMTGVAQLVAPGPANGSLLTRSGVVVGSELIGQSFTSETYFHGRPSAAGDKGYDAASSSGSNLGPLSKKLQGRIAGDTEAVKKDGASLIPADAVTASGSGLDPHISPAYAHLQVARVAAARGLSQERVRQLVEQAMEPATFGIFGEPRLNVLKLNLSLDAIGPARAG